MALRPILIVEDSLDDAFILSRLISKSGVRNPLQFARDGEEASDRLAKTAWDSDFLPPLALFTDLHMPRCDGFALLTQLRSRWAVHRIFATVVTSSDAPADVRKAFELGCHAYIRKYPTGEDCHRLCVAAESFAAGEAPFAMPGFTASYQG